MNPASFSLVRSGPSDRKRLAEVYQWAKAKPEAYLEGTGLERLDDFIKPLAGAMEFFVSIEEKLVALLTFLPVAPNEYQVGLISAPRAPVFKLLSVLEGAAIELASYGVTALHLRLPEARCYHPARRLAQKMQFTQLNATDWKRELTNGHS